MKLVAACLATLGATAGCEDSSGTDDDTSSSAGGQSGVGGSGAAGGNGGSGGTVVDPLAVDWEPIALDGSEPAPRWGHVAAWLDAGRALVFGGTRSGVENVTLNDAWIVDDVDGALTFTEVAAPGGPDPRYCGCAVYDPDRDTVLVVGGRNLGGPLASETWELDLTAMTWTQAAVAESPPGVVGCAIARTSATGSIYLFGGGGSSGFDGATYRYDAATPAWVELAATGPSGRYDAALREDAQGNLLLFSGSAQSTFHADVWRFDTTAETWTEVVMSGDAIGRRTPWVAPGAGGFYVGFGVQGAQSLSDLWFADMETNTWTLITGDAAPGRRAFMPTLPGGDGAIGVVLGGYDGSAPMADAWRLVTR